MTSDIKIYEIESYYPSSNKDYAGIPFIEFCPPLSYASFESILGTTARITDEERKHSQVQRLQYSNRVLNVFLPMDEQIDFAMKLWNFIQFGYHWRWSSIHKGVSGEGFKSFLGALADGRNTENLVPHHRDSMWFATLIGTPGCGKTATPLSLLSQLGPGLLYHRAHGEVFQLLHAHVKAPKNAKEKGIAEAIFRRLREYAIATDLPFPFRTGRIPKTVWELKDAIAVLARKLNLGLLTIDEADSLFPGTTSRDSEAMKFLTDLANEIKVPTLLIGTWELLPKLGTQLTLSRRSVGGAAGFFKKLQKDAIFGTVAESVFSVQATRNVAPWSEHFFEVFYKHTQGIPDLISKLHRFAQIAAVADDIDCVNAEYIDRVALESMSVIAPCIALLRNGRSERDREVWDLEPENYEEYVAKYLAAAELRIALGGRGAVRRAGEVAKTGSELFQLLQRMGVSSDVASNAATSMAQAAPGETAVSIAAKLIKEAEYRAPRPTRSKDPARIATADAEIGAFESLDIRRICYFATRKGAPIEEALRQAGYIRSAANELEAF